MHVHFFLVDAQYKEDDKVKQFFFYFTFDISKIGGGKTRIRDTPNLSTDANRSTDTEKLDRVSPLISDPRPTSSTNLSSTMQNHYMI